MTHAINLLVTIILTLFGLILEAITVADAFLAALMTSAGLPANMQIALLIVAALMLVVLALRVLGGVFSALLIVLLILLIAHRLLPGMQVPHSLLPQSVAPSGSVHI